MGKNNIRYLLVAVVLLIPVAYAGAQETTAVILPVEVKGLDTALGAKIEGAVAVQVGSMGVLKTPTPKVSSDTFGKLKKKKIPVDNCGNKLACIQAVGKAFNVKVIYHIMAAKAQEGVTLTMRIFDAKSGKEMRKAVEFATNESAEIERAARWAILKVSSTVVGSLIKGKGKLLVQCSEGGADLTINGKSFGKKTDKSFKVSAGVFEIVVSKEGFVPYKEIVMVRPDEEQVVRATMVSETGKAVAAAPVKTDTARSSTEAPPVSTEPRKEQTPKAELPAWALFETTKEAGRIEQPAATVAPKHAEVSPRLKAVTEQPAFAQKPVTEKVAIEETPKSTERKFYQTWWFWTIVGGVVVAGGTTAAVLLLKQDDSPNTGSATISWQ